MSGAALGRDDSKMLSGLPEITRGLKTLARKLDVPVLALSQLRRAGRGRLTTIEVRAAGSAVIVGARLDTPRDSATPATLATVGVVARAASGIRHMLTLTGYTQHSK